MAPNTTTATTPAGTDDTPVTPKRLVGLPLIVVSPVDAGRLVRELDAIHNTLAQQKIQGNELKVPKTTVMMDALIEMNKVDLLVESDRARLVEFMTAIKDRAPLLHISFGADPSVLFVENLIGWLRENIHPLAMMTIGLQPSIGAGCMVRTNNKYFDFSLSHHFSKNRELLMKSLREGMARQAEVPAPLPAAQAVGVAAA